MNNISKKMMAAVLAFVMLFSVSITPANAAEETAKKAAYVTIEKFTIGQGYVLAPTKVEVSDGDTYFTTVKKAAEANGIQLIAPETAYGTYISGIKNADSGEVNIPKEISNLGDYYGSWTDTIYQAPTNSNITPNTSSDLSEKCYTSLSGWMYKVNNDSSSLPTDTVKDGDVIRLQFSIFGYGLDLGNPEWKDEGEPEPRINLANEDNAIKFLADLKESGENDTYYNAAKKLLEVYSLNQEAADYIEAGYKAAKTTAPAKKEQLVAIMDTIGKDAEAMKNLAVKAAYDNAKLVNEDENATQQMVDSALLVLTSAYQNYIPDVPTISKASIKSIKNVKTRKAKITIKKLDNVTGYQIKYSTNSKFKKATTKTTSKTTFKTAKIAKKKTVYVRVRGYVKVNGTRYYGSWSATKKVKIKK